MTSSRHAELMRFARGLSKPRSGAGFKTGDAVDLAQVRTLLPQRRRRQREGRFQIGLLHWWRLAHGGLGVRHAALLFHIPNGGQMSEAQRKIAAAMGVRPGMPDLFLAIPRAPHAGLFLELKAPRTGYVRPEQRALHEHLRAEGYAVVVVRTLAQATAAIEGYLRNGCAEPNPFYAPG